ncbi:MAG: sigma-54-dependent Fis family transcriptional regulator [Chlorobi bacterium CHB1]|nr:sigma-54-dependent Fis family transcriptional regulator [Chlorobi bacterium CHB1]
MIAMTEENTIGRKARKYNILVVDDDRNICKMIEINLRKEKEYIVETANSGEACLKAIRETIPDLILLDIQMPGIDGIETLTRIRNEEPRIPVVMMSAHGTIEKAVKSMKLGAYDFIQKPFPSDRLLVTVRNALTTSSLKQEIDSLRSELKDRFQFKNIIGQSGVMQEVFRALEKVVNSNVTVLTTQQQAVRRGKLLGFAGVFAGKRIVRARKGRLHRGHRQAHRQI